MHGRKRTSYKLFSAVAIAVGLALCATLACAQDSAAPASTAQPVTASPIPRLINFSGTIGPQITQITQNQTQASTPTRAIDISFSLYELQEGGAPLWSESQKVQLDEQGHYTVLLGSTQPEGLPLDLFTSGKAQWLGVQPQLPGAVEQPRVLLVGMPYALKAADADTLGGLPASAFLQAGAQASESAAVVATTRRASLPAQAATEQAPAAPSGSGTTDYLPLWINSTTLGNSVLFQSGTGSTAKVGLNTTTPATTLDVNGAGTVRGTLSLPATGTASASVGKNSEPASLQASAYNGSTHAAVNQTFNLQAEPTGNDTSSPSGKLNLLFASGTGTPAETGLSISSNGKITFAAGQTFPGTGTITGVTTASGSGLTGGGTAGALTLSLEKTCATNQVLRWNGSSWVCATMSTGTITGVTAGTDLTGGGTSGTVTLNLDTTKVPLLSGSNTFAVNQRFKGNGNSATIGDMGCGSGYVGLSLFTGSLNCTNYAILGDTFGNLYINRPSGGALNFREGNGTELSISPGGSITAIGNIAAASFTGDGSQLTNVATLAGNNGFNGFNYFQQATTFTGSGEAAVIGDMGCGGSSVGITFQAINCASYALLDYGGQTILNRVSGQNMSFREGNNNAPEQMTLLSGGGINLNPGGHQVIVSANGTEADYPGGTATVTVLNYTSDTNTEMFLALAPNNTDANCMILTSGDLVCNGSLISVASIDAGSRVVALNATQSPENWFEDYGSATLVNGVATVALEPAYAQTINTAVGYHVFAMPKGDCRGLYVTNETATSFEVHELAGGTANIEFDYRIVAKRKGYENIRLADKTEMYNQMKAHADQAAAARKR